MENNTDTITASEINRFSYCPYQWYYERYYGRKELRRLYNERNKKIGYTDSAFSNFKRGLDYHYNEYKGFCFKSTVIKISIISTVLLATVGYLYFRVNTGV